ncbi:hypothetical protein [Sphingobacterium bambusae]|uniref:Uncharacterized protein n=1 Tax=Sphingobacterium bambusae TaxID=662858 RepID=A0ABW6BPV2_9SPHI|nr:hypothetical protein [Sphingobacterium bambusae]WPL47917.1 hypothetical protein SCB77_18370 [Sphingobacterium bambusae]
MLNLYCRQLLLFMQAADRDALWLPKRRGSREILQALGAGIGQIFATKTSLLNGAASGCSGLLRQRLYLASSEGADVQYAPSS